jgi:hypothetical protein
MRSVVAIAPSRGARAVLVPELVPADADGAEPAAVALRPPRAKPPLACAVEYVEGPAARRGDLLDVYC